MPRPLKPETAFSARLVDARRCMSREKFARLLEVPKSTLGNWERGRTFPPPEMLIKMAKVLNVSLDWLIAGCGERRPVMACGESQPWSAPRLDEELHGHIVEGVMTVYKEEEASLLPRHLGQHAARIHADLMAAYDAPEERQIGLKLALEHLRQELRQAADPRPCGSVMANT